MIYFMQSPDGGPIKIGTTTNLYARHKQLEQSHKKPLVVLGTQAGGRDEEQALHQRFSHLRIERTEWFVPDTDLLAFLGTIIVDQNPDLTESKVPVKSVKPIRLDLPEDIHRLLRVSAANHNRSMTEHARRIVEQSVIAYAQKHCPNLVEKWLQREHSTA